MNCSRIRVFGDDDFWRDPITGSVSRVDVAWKNITTDSSKPTKLLLDSENEIAAQASLEGYIDVLDNEAILDACP